MCQYVGSLIGKPVGNPFKRIAALLYELNWYKTKNGRDYWYSIHRKLLEEAEWRQEGHEKNKLQEFKEKLKKLLEED